MNSATIASAVVLFSSIIFWWYRSTRSTNYFQLSGVRAPTPLPHFDVDKTLARPYRPFRWEYHQTMSLKAMDPDRWIELESTYKERIKQRNALYAKYGKKIIDCLPGAESACRELMEMVVQFICVRYPGQFSVDYRSGLFNNRILGTTSNIFTIEPLHFLLQHVPEDFLITQPDSKTGLYTFRAGVSCSSVGWNVSTKIGLDLSGIHAPVPDYEDKMAFSMNRFFSSMKVDKPIQRGSWSLEIGQPLFLQEDEPDFRQSKPNVSLDDIHLRVDWQTLRRLPRSRAIVFNFKPLFTSVKQFRHEPYIPRLLLRILRESKASLLEYKATSHVEHIVIPALWIGESGL
ncbi:hypothetical protein MIND_01066100 [Mycena indigotica]|uniref:Uncharacterized protein n=1 Tax=Mycena indigotica TaxID=2126181 RepID=A0A8H6SCD4_9AGAR|nr:uncharacterized protein MIND_01066100 [Mycena indigotica]KAF7295270.1 hypothetical protein MIND_01066100 [Mycena indigotica]